MCRVKRVMQSHSTLLIHTAVPQCIRGSVRTANIVLDSAVCRDKSQKQNVRSDQTGVGKSASFFYFQGPPSCERGNLVVTLNSSECSHRFSPSRNMESLLDVGTQCTVHSVIKGD